jgi:protein-S-isoprenylcysteine O-methyltransferase Ste14
MTKKLSYLLLSPYLMWLLVGAGIAALFATLGREKMFVFPPVWWGYALAAAALAYWMYFFMKGVTSNLEGSFRPHHITKVVTGSVYAKVRHPVYSADIVLAWGVFFAYPMFAVLLSAAWLTIVLCIWAKFEEESMSQLFGEQYEEYKKQVPMLFPRFGDGK